LAAETDRLTDEVYTIIIDLEEDIVDIKNASATISDAVKEVIYSKGVDSTNYNFNFTDEFVRSANDLRDSNTKNDGDAGL